MLIAESGSTKTEWRYCRAGKVERSFKSPGFNPNVMSREKILAQFQEVKTQYLSDLSAGQIFFYGAGTRGEAQNRTVTEAIAAIFPGAEIFVGYDLLAAARSTMRGEGIACILGTGSNSCLHKGGEIVEIHGGLGYIFGDEGSGGDLGKHLMKGMLQDDFPVEVKEKILRKEAKSLDQLKMDIIIDPKPNVKMASLAAYIPELIHIQEIEQMVVNRFLAFLDTTVLKMNNYVDLPLDFIGSVGYYFSDQVKQACKQRGLKPMRFVKDPIDNLVEYHLKD